MSESAMTIFVLAGLAVLFVWFVVGTARQLNHCERCHHQLEPFDWRHPDSGGGAGFRCRCKTNPSVRWTIPPTNSRP